MSWTKWEEFTELCDLAVPYVWDFSRHPLHSSPGGCGIIRFTPGTQLVLKKIPLRVNGDNDIYQAFLRGHSRASDFLKVGASRSEFLDLSEALTFLNGWILSIKDFSLNTLPFAWEVARFKGVAETIESGEVPVIDGLSVLFPGMWESTSPIQYMGQFDGFRIGVQQGTSSFSRYVLRFPLGQVFRCFSDFKSLALCVKDSLYEIGEGIAKLEKQG